MKDGAYVMNLDEYRNLGTYWIAFYANDDKFFQFGVEFIF